MKPRALVYRVSLAQWIFCPKCAPDNIQERPTRKPQPYRCRSCRKDFSVKTDSLMHNSPLGYQTWLVAIYLITTGIKGTSSMKLHRDLGITQRSAWYLAHRIRENFEDQQIDPFAGPVEADEGYFGGLEGNKHANKKKRLGRGTAGKTTVAAIKDRDTGQVMVRLYRERMPQPCKASFGSIPRPGRGSTPMRTGPTKDSRTTRRSTTHQ